MNTRNMAKASAANHAKTRSGKINVRNGRAQRPKAPAIIPKRTSRKKVSQPLLTPTTTSGEPIRPPSPDPAAAPHTPAPEEISRDALLLKGWQLMKGVY